LPHQQVIIGVIADIRFSPHAAASTDPPLDWLSLELTTLGLNSEGAVVPVIPPYILVCGAIDPSTPEGIDSRYPIWPSHEREGTGHSPLPFWRFPAYPFLGSKVINLSMRTGKLELAEVVKRVFALASTGTRWRHPWDTREELNGDDADMRVGKSLRVHFCHEKPMRPDVGRSVANSLGPAVLWEASEYSYEGKQPTQPPISFHGGGGGG